VKVYFLAGAEEDLRDLRRYRLRTFDESAWLESHRMIKESVRLLQDNPDIGSVPDELMELHFDHYRQLVSGMNRIFYEIREYALYIHIICDSRRDMRSLLSRRLLRPTRTAPC
jgi:plasmid stabilization system protein ParE